jgi:hypothetical protein
MTWHFTSHFTPLRKADDAAPAAAPDDAPAPGSGSSAGLRRLVQAAQPALVALVLKALTTLGTDADAEALRAALLAGDTAQATALLAAVAGMPVLTELGPLLLALMQATSTASLPSLQAALAHLLTTQEALVGPTTQQALPASVETVQSWQLSVAQAARLAQRMVGLTRHQVQTLTRYRTLLEEQETAPARALQLLEQRLEALRRQRAERIAQTTSMQAVNAAQRLQVEQAIQRGERDGTRVRRWWRLGDDPCTVCQPIPGLNPEGRAMGEPFATPAGLVQEPPLHPHCYCTIGYRA